MKFITREHVVIVGGGAAAAECAASLRMSRFAGAITVISAERNLPYELPALSKAFLTGSAGYDDIVIRPQSSYTDHDISLRLGVEVVSIDSGAHEIHLGNGETVPYDKLVIATGGRSRELSAPGAAESTRLHYFRSLEDAEKLRSRLMPSARLVVVGGGYLGLEVASAARHLGATVTVLEAMPRLLARVTSPAVSAFFARMHREEGVDVRLDTTVNSIFDVGNDQVKIELEGGEQLEADLVLVSIGLVPSVELAEKAGIEVDNGIRIDEFGRTSVPDIYAAGDCTSHPDFENGGYRRLESLPNANETATTVAATILGQPRPYTSTPWFWSEQYGTRLQTVGLYRPGDEACVRGPSDVGRSFSVFYIRDGQVRAADIVSSPRDFAVAKSLVSQRIAVNPSDLTDMSIPLKDVLKQAKSRETQSVAPSTA
ncbi:NAD(P)/FAD-dependent oxidoreductase [Rhodococcus koreensis]